MALILVVDDDAAVVMMLQDVLSHAGHSSIFASNGMGALHQLEACNPDLIILDLKLPDVDGLILIGKIREISELPIIVLSARDGQSDRVMALDGGADDFLAKPFDVYELEARIAVVLRRASRQPVTTEPSWHVGVFSIAANRDAILDGVEFPLTPIERRLMLALVAHAGKVVSHENLILAGWGSPDGVDTLNIGAHLARVRARLKRVPGAPTITAVEGHGYTITA